MDYLLSLSEPKKMYSSVKEITRASVDVEVLFLLHYIFVRNIAHEYNDMIYGGQITFARMQWIICVGSIKRHQRCRQKKAQKMYRMNKGFLSLFIQKGCSWKKN